MVSLEFSRSTVLESIIWFKKLIKPFLPGVVLSIIGSAVITLSISSSMIGKTNSCDKADDSFNDNIDGVDVADVSAEEVSEWA